MKPSVDVDMSSAETVMLTEYNDSVRNTKVTGGQQAADSDEDEDEGQPRGGQRVQCAQ